MRHANWTIVNSDDKQITIMDMGPWDVHPTITNDAEWVVLQMVAFGLSGRRLYYVDSEGQKDELRVADGRFAGFGPGPRP